jgi:hypothetical protein
MKEHETELQHSLNSDPKKFPEHYLKGYFVTSGILCFPLLKPHYYWGGGRPAGGGEG